MERKGAAFLDRNVPAIGRRFPLGSQREIAAKGWPKSTAVPWKSECEPLNLELIKSMLMRPGDYSVDQIRKQLLTCFHEQLLNMRKQTKDTMLESLCCAAMSLAAACPAVVKHQFVLSALAELVRPTGSSAMAPPSVAASVQKTKVPLQDVYVGEVIRILGSALAREKEWPSEVLMMYVRDAVTDRVWVDYEPFRAFVSKIESAFKTTNVDMGAAGAEDAVALMQQPATNLLNLSSSHTEGSHVSTSSSLSGEDTMSVDSGGENNDATATGSADTGAQFSHISHADMGKMCLEWLAEFVPKKPFTTAESSNRNLIRFLTTAAGVPKVREYAMPKLDNWLASPNVAGIAKRLFAVICANINVNAVEADMQRIQELCTMRIKSKMMSDHFVKCYKLCITANPSNLDKIMAVIVNNEIDAVPGRQSALFAPILFAFDRERCSKLLALLLCNAAGRPGKGVDFKRNLSSRLLRDMIQCARGQLDVQAFFDACCSAWNSRKEVNRDADTASAHNFDDSEERSIINTIIELINVALEAHRNALVRSLPSTFDSASNAAAAAKVNKFADFVRGVHENMAKILFSKQISSVYTPQFRFQCFVSVLGLGSSANAEQEYFALPNSQVADLIAVAADILANAGGGRAAIALRLLPQVEIVELLLDLYTSNVITSARVLSVDELLSLMDQIAMRSIAVAVQQRLSVATTASTFAASLLNVSIVEQLLHLCQFDLPAAVVMPKNLKSIVLYRAKLYWRVNLLLLLFSCYAPHTVGRLCWREQPNVRVLMEMVIVNQFKFPPPTMGANRADGIEIAPLRVSDARQREEDSKIIADIQARIARVRDRAGIDGAELDRMPQSLLRKPVDAGVVLEPPAAMLKNVEEINRQMHLGRSLCQSRSPDFLKDIIDAKGTSSCVSWLLELMEESDTTYRVMPVECICELLCHELTKSAGSSDAVDTSASTATSTNTVDVKPSGTEAFFTSLELNAKRCSQLLSRISSLIPDAVNNNNNNVVHEVGNGQKILAFFGSRLYASDFETRQAARAALYALKDVKLLRNTSKFKALQQQQAKNSQQQHDNNMQSCFMPSISAISRPTQAGATSSVKLSETLDVNQRTSILSSMLKAAARDFSPAQTVDETKSETFYQEFATVLQQSLLLSTNTARYLLSNCAADTNNKHRAASGLAEDKFLVQLNLDNFGNSNDGIATANEAIQRSFVGFLAQALRVETEPQVILSYIEWLAAPQILLLMQKPLSATDTVMDAELQATGNSSETLEYVVRSLSYLINYRQLVCEMLLSNRAYSDRAYTSAAKIISVYLAGDIVPEYFGNEAQAALDELKRAKFVE